MPPVDLTKALIKKRKRSGGGGGSNRPLTPPTGSAHYVHGSHPAPGVYVPSSSGGGRTVASAPSGPSRAQVRAQRRVKRAKRQKVQASKNLGQIRTKLKQAASKTAGINTAKIPDLGNARSVAGLVSKYQKRYAPNIKPSVLMAQIEQESGFNPLATQQEGKTPSESQGGGETQFIPSTAAAYGVHYGSSRKAVKSQLKGQAKLMGSSGSSTREALGSYYGDHNPHGAYANSIVAKAKAYKAVDRAKPKPVPMKLKKRAVAALGKTKTKKIIRKAWIAKSHPEGLPKGYVHPVEGGTTGRTDMGVDFSGSGAKIRSMGKAKVVKLGAPGWPEGGGVLYQLLDGPRKGKYVYNYEGITPTVRVGQTVKAGQQIGTITGSSIEIGWSDASGAPLAHSTYQEGDVTKQGSHFAKFIGGTASAPTTGSGSAVASSSGFGTTGASTASAASSTAAASSSPDKSREARHRAQEADRRRRRAASVIGTYRRSLKPIQVKTKKTSASVKKAPKKKIKLGL